MKNENSHPALGSRGCPRVGPMGCLQSIFLFFVQILLQFFILLRGWLAEAARLAAVIRSTFLSAARRAAGGPFCIQPARRQQFHKDDNRFGAHLGVCKMPHSHTRYGLGVQA